MQTLKPGIRFKGFTDDWEQRKLGELCQVTSGIMGNTFLAEGVFRITRIETIANGYVDENRIGFTNEKPDDSYKLQKGDILYSNINSISQIGKVAQYKGDTGLYHGINLLRLRINESIISHFVYYQLNTYTKKNWARINANPAVNQASINRTLLESQEIQVCKIEEQQKIGSLFEQTDKLITLYKQKYEKLATIKKSLLAKMFPAEGESAPQIRFKGFTEPWQKRKLGDICSSFSYGLNVAAKEFDGKNKYVRITDIDDETRTFMDSDITSPDTDLAYADDYRLQERDIVFARTGASVGKTFIYKKTDGLVYYAGFLIRGRVRPEYSSEFVFQNTLTEQYSKFIRLTSQRSGQPGVNAREYAEFDLYCPSYLEQQQIGAFFAKLDNLIATYKQKYEKLQTLKNSLLDKMFV